MVRFRSLVCLLAIAIAGVSVDAQQITGSIRGTVVDPSGAVVSGATVAARQTETGLTRTAVTDRVGAYVVLELPVGHYEVQVEAKGFQKYIQQGIVLDVNETANVPVRLSVGAETEQVQVHADAQLIESGVTSLGKTVSEREVLDLPLNGRNFTQLGLLQPGVVPLTPGLAEAGGSLREGQAYAVNGQRPESNNFLIDGAKTLTAWMEALFSSRPWMPSLSSEFLRTTPGAEFGQSLGSTTNIITRSGTNRFHGALWEFLRNDAFDATNDFAAKTEPLKQNQFGATLWRSDSQGQDFLLCRFRGFPEPPGGKRRRPRCHPLLRETVLLFALCPEGFTAGFCNNQNHQPVQCVPQPALSQQSVSRRYPNQSNYAKSLAVHSVSQLGNQRLYYDAGGAPGFKPGRRENRSLPHAV